jgi:hypothetical protein
MALAYIDLKLGKTYTRGATNKVYIQGQRVTSSDPKEIKWAKNSGFFSVVDLEEAANELKRLKAGIKQAAKASNGGRADPAPPEEEDVPDPFEDIPAEDTEDAEVDGSD